MTGYESKRAAAQDKLDDDDALTIAYQSGYYDGKKAAQPAQEPVAYDKTEMNGFVQDLYDKKMQEGKHGHYETMFHVVHQAIKRATPPQPAQEPVAYLCKPDQHGLFDPPTPDKACKDCFPVYTTPPQRPWVGLTAEEATKCWTISAIQTWFNFENALKEKNS